MKDFKTFVNEALMPGYKKLFRFGPVTGLKFTGKRDPKDKVFSKGETDDVRYYTAGNHELWVRKHGAVNQEPVQFEKLPADFSYRDHFKNVRKVAKKNGPESE